MSKKSQRHAAVPLPGPDSAAQDKAGAASQAALRRTVRGGVRRAVIRPDQHVCGRYSAEESDDAPGAIRAITLRFAVRCLILFAKMAAAAFVAFSGVNAHELGKFEEIGHAPGLFQAQRPDCEQMVIALIVNSEGFPFSYETFDGNRADVSTMETILRMVERKYGKADGSG